MGDIIPLPKRKPAFPDYAGPTERPLWPGGIDDLWPSPDHWRSLDPPREGSTTFLSQGAMNWPIPQIPPTKPLGLGAWKFDPPRDIKATGDRSDET